ncbi:MAG: Asp-tRNA(Asn)/Glu-tRNA(Gln) amidotransferase subunit GatB [Patescibacteria group bacterium]|nr:Asp-tRNA(Asn)/Glu-tRNA(Gln) amidotransferase subunit GatB [Patescibacteria group bacterium]
MKYPYPIIGLEIHVELKTKSKMFCQCSADYFGKAPNSQVCPVCLGLPGALPVPNKTAVEWTIRIAQALGCTVPERSKFDRKHYFYPDLPKGYQISQYDEPIGINGRVAISDGIERKEFRIRRVHIEEDTGKLIHKGGETLIDFNRSSVPLVEIVTEADFHNSGDVKRFLEELQVIIRTLDVANADMEKGDMRLEPNISVLYLEKGQKWDGKTFPKYKVEVKNINSFRFAKMAIDYELERQTKLLENGETPVQETRGFNEKTNATVSQRTKEDAHDYRYFPEPDIPVMVFGKSYLERIRQSLPELPTPRAERLVAELGLRFQDAFLITRVKSTADLYEMLVAKMGKDKSQKIANHIVNRKVDVTAPVEEVVSAMEALFAEKNADPALLEKAVADVCAANGKVVTDYKNGKQQALMFLVGQVMRQMRGQADAADVTAALRKYLD